jgi:hypothetical protein
VIAQDLADTKERGLMMRVMVCASAFDGDSFDDSEKFFSRFGRKGYKRETVRDKAIEVFGILKRANIHHKAVTLTDGNLFHEKFWLSTVGGQSRGQLI